MISIIIKHAKLLLQGLMFPSWKFVERTSSDGLCAVFMKLSFNIINFNFLGRLDIHWLEISLGVRDFNVNWKAYILSKSKFLELSRVKNEQYALNMCNVKENNVTKKNF